MKNTILFFFTVTATIAVTSLKAQNIFPATGNAGIGTTHPTALLQVKDGTSKFGAASSYANIDSVGNLSFKGNAAYQVAGNKFVFQYSANKKYGLFFNSTALQYEFRNNLGKPAFYISANNGNGVFTGNLKIGAYTLPSADGSNGQVLSTNGSGVISWNSVSGGSSQWITKGANIYYNKGNVGIGLVNPAYALDMNGDINMSSGSVLRINASPVLFDDAANQNLFVGDNAGIVNTGYNNVAVGPLSMNKNTGGNYNTAVGANSLGANISGASNTAMGEKSQFKNTSGFYNTSMGSGSLYTNISSNDNVAIGYQSLYNTTTADNVAVGFKSGYANTTGSANTSIGSQSMYSNTTGGGNLAIGYQSLYSNTSGAANIAIGNAALNANQTGLFNVAVGSFALSHNNAFGNTAVGAYALNLNSTGTQNAAFGFDALTSNSTGSSNTASGYNSLLSNTTGAFNTSFGANALKLNVTGAYNTAVGSTALLNNSGSSNTAIGEKALQNNTTGGSNTALGSGAMQNNISSANNTALGFQALYNSTYFSDDNTAVGYQSLYNTSTGSENTAIGYQAGYVNNGNFNIFVGYNSGQANTSGSANVFMGLAAGQHNTTGSFNTYIGYASGGLTTTNSNNTFYGYGSGSGSNGDNNSFVGYYAKPNSSALSNCSSFGFQSVATANSQIFLGAPSLAQLACSVALSVLSDGRYKKNITENVPGLIFINKLNPVTYNLNVHDLDKKLNITEDKLTASEADKKEKQFYTGFIAQEVEKAANEIGYNFSGVSKPQNDGDFYMIRYSDFIMPLVKAVQELSAKNDSLVQNNTSMQSQINDLKTAVEMLENKAGVSSPVSTMNASLSSASLAQNIPNPYNQTTSIQYNLPATFSTAQIVVTDFTGKILKTINISGQGKGILQLDASTFAAGIYNYSLYVNGKIIDTKKMVLSK